MEKEKRWRERREMERGEEGHRVLYLHVHVHVYKNDQESAGKPKRDTYNTQNVTTHQEWAGRR